MDPSDAVIAFNLKFARSMSRMADVRSTLGLDVMACASGTRSVSPRKATRQSSRESGGHPNLSMLGASMQPPEPSGTGLSLQNAHT